MFTNYPEWNHKKIKVIIDYLSPNFFKNKTILEIGARHGDVVNAFARLGANCEALEIRDEHINVGKRKYPHLNWVKEDAENPFFYKNRKWDIILSMGIACHVKNLIEHINLICQASDYIVLETECIDSFEEKLIDIPENSNVNDWGINNIGSKPSSALIEKLLKNNGFVFKRLDTNKLNCNDYVYDWQIQNSNQRKWGHRRFWIAKKEFLASQNTDFTVFTPNTIFRTDKISQPVSSAYLINKQTSILHGKEKITAGFKTAVCISGHLRTFEKTYKSFKTNIIDQLQNVDVFIHTWDSLGYSQVKGDAPFINEKTNNYLEKINELYNPKKILIENFKEINGDRFRSRSLEKNPSNSLNMFYSIYMTNKLKKDFEKENNIKYNMCIRTRGDILYQAPFNFNLLDNLNGIWVPNSNDLSMINDTFAVSSSKFMDIYSMCLDYVDEYFNKGLIFKSETLLKKHFENFNLNFSKNEMSLAILSGDNKITKI